MLWKDTCSLSKQQQSLLSKQQQSLLFDKVGKYLCKSIKQVALLGEKWTKKLFLFNA